MPVIAPPSYADEAKKAGSSLENAAEEILNGLFCHYEPPTSTKAQKSAAQAVKKNPTKFLYEEQPITLRPKKKKGAKGGATTPSSDAASVGSEYYESEADTDAGDYEEDEATLEEDLDDDDEDEEVSLLKVKTGAAANSKRGIKWRDEESKRLEKEKATVKAASRWSECVTLPCFASDKYEIPGTLEDIHDENEAPQEPTPVAVGTPSKSALKKRDDGVMKVLYDDQGNPNTTPRSPGTIKNHSFFRNVTNSPGGGMYEPKNYDRPSTPKSTGFKMPRNYTPRIPKGPPAPPSDVGAPSPRALGYHEVTSPAPPTPTATASPVWQRQVPISPMNVAPLPGSSGVSEYTFDQALAPPPARVRQIGPLPGSNGINDHRGGPEVIRLAKIGRSPVNTAAPQQAWNGVDPAVAQTGTYVAKSPKSYMAPAAAPVAPGVPQPVNRSVNPGIEEPEQMSVLQAVQMLNKAGFNPGKRFNRGFNQKSFKKAPPKSPSVRHHGYATENDNRDSLDGEQKLTFVGTRRVAVPTSSVPSNNNNNNKMALLNEIKYRNKANFPPLELNTDPADMRDELEMARDPTPRQMKIQQLEESLSSNRNHGPLPPTPRRKEQEPEYATRPTPTAQKPPQHFVPANSSQTERTGNKERTTVASKKSQKKEVVVAAATPKEEKKVESAPKARVGKKPTQSRSRSASQPKKEKKGFMSGIKKGFGKFKNAVNEIDSQRIPEPVKNNKKSGSSRREVRMA